MIGETPGEWGVSDDFWLKIGELNSCSEVSSAEGVADSLIGDSKLLSVNGSPGESSLEEIGELSDPDVFTGVAEFLIGESKTGVFDCLMGEIEGFKFS